MVTMTKSLMSAWEIKASEDAEIYRLEDINGSSGRA